MQNKFKRLRRLEDDDSDNEGNDDPELEREVIAEKLFVGGSDEVCVILLTSSLTEEYCHLFLYYMIITLYLSYVKHQAIVSVCDLYIQTLGNVLSVMVIVITS